jgi:hypothetical protein
LVFDFPVVHLGITLSDSSSLEDLGDERMTLVLVVWSLVGVKVSLEADQLPHASAWTWKRRAAWRTFSIICFRIHISEFLFLNYGNAIQMTSDDKKPLVGDKTRIAVQQKPKHPIYRIITTGYSA